MVKCCYLYKENKISMCKFRSRMVTDACFETRSKRKCHSCHEVDI